MNQRIRLVYFLPAVAPLVALLAAKNEAWWLVVAACVTGLTCLAYEFSYDRLTVCLFLVVVLGSYGVVVGIATWLGPSPFKVALLVGIIVAWAAAGWGWYSARASLSDFPDLLGNLFDPNTIFETRDVQWCVVSEGLCLGEVSSLVFYLQNCVHASRNCQITLKEVTGFWRRSGFVIYPDQTAVTLAAGEVRKITFPLRPTGKIASTVRLFVSLHVEGERATRNRSVARRPLSQPVSPWIRILLIPFGVLVWGGGLKVKYSSLGLQGSRPYVRSQLQLENEILYPVGKA